MLTYRISRDDVIEAVNDEWSVFATENGAPQLAHVAGLSLWTFVEGRTTRQVYRELLARVRDGHDIVFSFRCDSPATRRLGSMTMHPAGRGAVEFRSVMRDLGPWPRLPHGVSLFEDAAMLQVCSWCKRVLVDGLWIEPERAVEILGLFQGDDERRTITHVICPACAQSLGVAVEAADRRT
jgi:hypothetical protein